MCIQARCFALAGGDEGIVALVDGTISATILRCSRVACT